MCQSNLLKKLEKIEAAFMYDSNRCFARSRLYNVILYRLVYCLFDIGLQTIAVTHCSILTFILNDIFLCLNCSTFHLQ